MHSETKAYEWDAHYFHEFPSAVWWRVPEEHGIVVHSFSWAPLLFDFAAVPQHDVSTFDLWTFDGDYVYRNLGNIKRVHLVLDSDEIFIASWGPLSDRPHDLSPQPQLLRRVFRPLVKRQQFNAAFYSGIFDPIKQRIFFEPARWHSKPLNEKWTAVERRALGKLYSCAAPPTPRRFGGMEILPARGVSRLERVYYFALSSVMRRVIQVTRVVPIPFLRMRDIVRHFWVHREALIPRLKQVLHGDRDVIRWLAWRMRELAYYLAVGRALQRDKPLRPNR
jgi:hypothetical protein